MKKHVLLVLAIVLTICLCSAGSAEGLSKLFGGSSDASSFLDDIGTIVGGLTADEAGIPKTIHYDDFELFKQEVDTLEAYFQEWADFMKTYDSNDLSMLADYTSLMARYVDAMRVWETIDESKMDAKEKKYYNTVLLRVNKILVDTAYSM